MHPVEFWLMYDAKQPPTMYGSMTEAQAKELYEETYGEDRNANS